MGSGQTRGWRGWVVASVVGALGLGLVGVAGAAAPVVRRVDSADSNCPTNTPPTVYCTIQAALDDANPGDTILVKVGADGGFYAESITINKRVNVVAGGDVTINGFVADCEASSFPPTVTMSGNGARLQGFRVINGCDDNILVTGNDNVVAANRVGRDCCGGTNGITLDNGAQRNIVVANVVLQMFDFGILVAWDAGPNNLLLHNVVTQGLDDGVNLLASKTTLIGNVIADNGRGKSGGDGIDIDASGITGTALKGNVALQNGCCTNNTRDHDIELHSNSQRPVLKGNTYERSAVDAGDN